MRYLATIIIVLVLALFLSPATSTVFNTPDHAAYAGDRTTTEKETEQDTDPPEDETKKLVRSKHERKVERRTNWIEGLEGDKARIYELYGHPSGKYREEVMGTVVERWVYPEHGVTFKFKGKKLTR